MRSPSGSKSCVLDSVTVSKRPTSEVGFLVGEKAQAAAIVVIESRVFFRDLLVQCLSNVADLNIVAVPTVEQWLELSKTKTASLILLCRFGKRNDEEARREAAMLSQVENPPPVVVLSDVEDTDRIVDALNRGACGYIPTNLSLAVAIEAMRLVRAGGKFVPASSLIAAHRVAESVESSQRPSAGVFTARQIAVVEALRMGKANKLIAYELNMCESTVKVHVRNIMKKLKAKNRTQVAFMAGELLRREQN